jgi:hypothetical protein
MKFDDPEENEIMRSSSILHSVIALLAIALLAVSGFAQDRTASLTGVVRDPSGAPIPNAQITVRNTETGIKRIARTSGRGDYTVTWTRSWHL